MSRRKSWRGMAIGVAVLALGIVVAVLIFGQGPGEDARDESSLTAEERDAVSDETSASAGDPAATTTSPLVATNDAGEIVPPKKPSSKPSSGSTGGSTGSTPGGSTGDTSDDPTDEAYQQYLHDTREVVEINAGQLDKVLDAVTVALSSGDAGALKQMVVTDEGDASAYARTLADRYPPLLGAETLPMVDVYSVGETTVYFAYQVVTWRDAGIESAHTIAVMFRFVNGEWQLTTLGETGSDLQLVQTVAL